MDSAVEKIRQHLMSGRIAGGEPFVEAMKQCRRARDLSLQSSDDLGKGWLDRSAKVTYDVIMESMVQLQYIVVWSEQIEDMIALLADEKFKLGHLESGELLVAEVWSTSDRIQPMEQCILEFLVGWRPNTGVKALYNADAAGRELLAALRSVS